MCVWRAGFGLSAVGGCGIYISLLHARVCWNFPSIGLSCVCLLLRWMRVGEHSGVFVQDRGGAKTHTDDIAFIPFFLRSIHHYINLFLHKTSSEDCFLPCSPCCWLYNSYHLLICICWTWIIIPSGGVFARFLIVISFGLICGDEEGKNPSDD